MSDEMTNEKRAERAFRAVQKYISYDEGSAYAQEEMETILGDMLCDLQHFAVEQGVDFERVVLNGQSHFEAEFAEENEVCEECEGSGKCDLDGNPCYDCNGLGLAQ